MNVVDYCLLTSIQDSEEGSVEYDATESGVDTGDDSPRIKSKSSKKKRKSARASTQGEFTSNLWVLTLR